VDTPLHILVKDRQFADCKFLLTHYAPVFLTNNDNQTAFYLLMTFYCCNYRFFDSELIELLLKAGADISEAQTLLVQHNNCQELRSFITAMTEKYPSFDVKEPEE
jgi:hypothetical protein